ncbi:putative liprin-alpha-2-like [Triplophysa rosa]|uniref:Liprin-alpha-2-like n=1 Tax=Triplophysa rosa TaxID=992332 RepID=A0A9W7T4Z1_TRIRA|nr:putative liprin-alpha-2-like [Triplophysa rosa]
MMCEVMPTISEDTALSQRGSQSSASDPDSHFEQLMVNMLDERDRLLDTLRETQESLSLSQQHLQDVIYDRDSLQRQLSSALPQLKLVILKSPSKFLLLDKEGKKSPTAFLSSATIAQIHRKSDGLRNHAKTQISSTLKAKVCQ